MEDGRWIWERRFRSFLACYSDTSHTISYAAVFTLLKIGNLHRFLIDFYLIEAKGKTGNVRFCAIEEYIKKSLKTRCSSLA